MKLLYRAFGYLGLVSVLGTLLYGFRYDPTAPRYNYLIDLGLYAVFAIPHLIMSRAWFKSAVWGPRRGTPIERQVYIIVTNVTWFAIFAVHRPLPGPAINYPEWLAWMPYVGTLCFLLSMIAFFEGVTFATIDGMLAIPGAEMRYSQGTETPLFTSGSYARVRHPMYRAAFLAGAASLLIHPTAAQVFWFVLNAGTFVGFIPVEERDMIAARGQAYRDYCNQTRYRLFYGVW